MVCVTVGSKAFLDLWNSIFAATSQTYFLRYIISKNLFIKFIL